MEKTVKILIIAFFVLVACLGVSIEFILQGNYLKVDSASASVINQPNSTASSVNNSNIQNSQNNTQVEKKVISEEKAHDLAQQYVNNDNGEGCAVTYGKLNNGVYRMGIYTPQADYIGNVYINAYTGKLIKINWFHY